MGEPRNRYSVVSLLMHWGIAAAVLAQVLLITAHENTEGPISGQFVMLHKSLGLTILVLTLARIGWRLAHPAIPLPSVLPRWQKVAARARAPSRVAMMRRLRNWTIGQKIFATVSV